MNKTLSTPDRNEILKSLSSQQFDVIIIGGGITGAGIALDSATRGFKTCLVEMQDFSSGTSSRSTKLIHGGLRYLEQYEFNLVREVGKERKVLYRNAPYLVHPENMLLPVIKNGKHKKWLVNIGLFMYDVLAGVVKNERRKMLSANQVIECEPLLASNKNVTGGAIYSEYQTDDSRLTIEVLKTAAMEGAIALNYIKVIRLLYSKNIVSGVVAKDQLTKTEIEIKGKYVVNCTGPWVDDLRSLEKENFTSMLHHTKGVHIVVEHEKFPVKQAVYFDAPDGRMIFAIPKNNSTYIGTTDTNYNGDLQEPHVTEGDKDYLLTAVNKIFVNINLKKADILASWAGIRPLIHQEGKKPSEISRKEEIIISSSGLISIAGGKLTGYRKMAEKIVDLVSKSEGKNIQCKTKNLALIGNRFTDRESVKTYISGLEKIYNFPHEKLAALVYRYGIKAEVILKKSTEFNENALLKAEIWYCINYEAAVKAEDFYVRRTSKIYFETKALESEMQIIKEEFGKRV